MADISEGDSSLKSIAWLDKNGTVLEASGGMLPIYSLTKTFIAAAILALGIDLNERVSAWFDTTWLPRGAEISVAMLLNHTAGLRDYGALPAYQQAVQAGQPPWSDEEFADHTLRQPLLFEPGAGWAYANPGYWLLRQIAQRESGLDFGEMIERTISAPLGLADTRAAQGIFSPLLPDYDAGWVWHGLLLSSALDVARLIHSELVAPLARGAVRVPGSFAHWAAPHYGYGLMIEPGVRFGHEGGGPGFSAACFSFIPEGLTGCALLQSKQDGAAFEHLLAELPRQR